MLFLSCPFAWYTGKIIGPELYGNALGAIGATIILLQQNKNKRISISVYVLGGFFIGLSTGVKSYNLLFGLFAGLYEICNAFTYEKGEVQIEIRTLFIKGCTMLGGCIIGFMFANPIILFDMGVYQRNATSLDRYLSQNGLIELFTRSTIEWDLVQSGGICHCIISICGLIILFILSCIFEKNRKITIAVFVTFAALVAMFYGNDRILGWYFIPLLFILPLCVTDNNLYVILLAANFAFVHSDTWYQIDSKMEQIKNVESEEQIEAFIEEHAREYPDYQKVYFVDVGLKHIEMDSEFFYVPKENQYIAISDRAKKNEHISQIYLMAVENINGYSLILEENGVSIVTYHAE